jgi:hypothetical protein
MNELPLAAWRDFYAMVGTAAGVIVGATFIVASLAAGLKDRAVGLRGFITPTAVHLGSVLVGCAILDVPTLTPVMLATLLGTGGVAGAIYSVIVATRIWGMNLDRSDRGFYAVLPILTYLAMALAATRALWDLTETLEILAASLVVLLIVGMRNAWDMTSFMVGRDRE